MSFPSQPRAVAILQVGQGGACSAFQYRNSPYQSIATNQLSATGVTAFKRLVPPIIDPNAESIAKEEGYIGYDEVAERLCYTDSTLTWRCMAVIEDIAGLNSDYVAAMLLVTNTVHTHHTGGGGYVMPTIGYHKLVNWTTAAPLVPSANWNNATGLYTAATAGKLYISTQASWEENGKNQGLRVLRIIHTNFLTTVTTIIAESSVNPSSNKKINTMQGVTAGCTVAVGDTVHVEVAQTCGVAKNVEGGGGFGAAGTTIQIIKLS